MRVATSFSALQKGGPYVGPKGGKWADPAHTIPWSDKKPSGQAGHSCARCGGRGFILQRQRDIFGGESTSAHACAVCNPKGKKPAGGHQLSLFEGAAGDVGARAENPKKKLRKGFKLQGGLTFQGLRIAIENRKGSKRHWTDHETGEAGSTTMVHPYGYIRGAKGADGEEVDVFVGPHRDSQLVFIVNQRQMRDKRAFDEHKVMLGFRSAAEARTAYLKHYDKHGPSMLGSLRMWTMDRFKAWLRDGNKTQPVAKSELA